MDKRAIGGLSVGAIGLGCMGMTFAYTTGSRDEAESVQVIHRALDLGVSLIDTSDVYGPFTNEELVGRALRDRRDGAVLATKVGLRIRPEQEGGGLYGDARPEHIRQAVHDSLRRLATDHIDLYQLHRIDPQVPLEDSWGALAGLVEEGLVGAIGLSEVGVAEIERAHAVHPVATVQNELSLWTRDDEVVSWTGEHGIGYIPFAPLGRGFLTGRYRSSGEFGQDDFRAHLSRFAEGALATNLRIVERVEAVAARHDATPGQIALAWVLAQGDHVVPIPGTKRLSHLEENLGAARIRLTDEDLTNPPTGRWRPVRATTSWSPPGPSTAGFRGTAWCARS